MMWSSIANLKENLNKIVLDVHEDDDDGGLEIYSSRHSLDPSSVSDRRFSHSFAHSMSPSSNSSLPNGFDSPFNPEIEQYKAEIKRLKESEAEIKALSVNYAALLKEKEDHIYRLNEEKGSLKQSLDATNTALKASKASTNSQNMLKGNNDQSPNRQHRGIGKNRSFGDQAQNGIVSKQDVLRNGTAHSMQAGVTESNMQSRRSSNQGNEKELADLLEEKTRSLAAIQAAHELQVKALGMELKKERDTVSNLRLKLQEEQKLSGSFQEELNLLKLDKDKASMEMNKIRDELNEKISEIRRLQTESNRREEDAEGHVVEDLKRVLASLENENSNLKMQKDELKVALKTAGNSSGQKVHPDVSTTTNKDSTSLNEKPVSLGSFPGKEEMEQSLRTLEKDLKEAFRERDKAIQQLNRLKQHLLEKESEESEKMDEDSKIIEELRETNEYLRAQILHLEKALKQAMTSQDEVKKTNNNELQKCKEIIDDLNKRVANFMGIIDAKNVELLNLQTALGQYYAEIEAKEHLEGDLARAREEIAKLSGLLEVAGQQAEISKTEKEEISAKVSQSERTLAEWKNRVNKLEEDNAKLRRALDQSMTRLNRMSMDSDYFVDRRIVIKLLVTYFQRNHSKEVLDLMVRMLGFSEEDKQRIGGAQQVAGKGVVRGVLGLPGRLVGGILGGGSAEAAGKMASDNQSFADLWVDFLLKETEERERREFAEAANRSKGDEQERSPTTSVTTSTLPDPRTDTIGSPPAISRFSQSSPQSLPPRGNLLHSDHSDSEFSTVPLNSSESSSRLSRLLPRY